MTLSPEEHLRREVRAGRARSFIYGTIATLIAIAAFDTLGAEPLAAGAIVAVSAIATWWAHAYSTVLAARLETEEQITWAEVRAALREAWPIVTAAVPATLLAIGATQGYWSLRAAVVAADIVGIVIMALAGLAAARTAHVGRTATVVWIVVAAGIGAVIVIVESAVHH
jgi:hypothetical protein